jgi:hypothetical protein
MKPTSSKKVEFSFNGASASFYNDSADTITYAAAGALIILSLAVALRILK